MEHSSEFSFAQGPEAPSDDDFAKMFDELFDESNKKEAETVEEVIIGLEAIYGGQVFYYGSYSGTVRDIAMSCPAIEYSLSLGIDAAAAWIEKYAQLEPDDDENDETEPDQGVEDEKDATEGGDDTEKSPQSPVEKAEAPPEPETERSDISLQSESPSEQPATGDQPSSPEPAVSAEQQVAEAAPADENAGEALSMSVVSGIENTEHAAVMPDASPEQSVHEQAKPEAVQDTVPKPAGASRETDIKATERLLKRLL